MGTVYLIPTFLAAESPETIPAYITDAIKNCEVFFVENERTTRRYFKQLWREMVIDNYEWRLMVNNPACSELFRKSIRENKTIGIVSEAGCPGVADPGQDLVREAQQMGAVVKPLVGPSSILLALMASGMNGQQFRFAGYLPIEARQRAQAIKEMETESAKKDCTQIFIETPYRNNQLTEALLKNCKPNTRLCIAADITSPNEWIKTKTIGEWQKNKPDIHKRPALFLLQAE